MKQAQKCKLLPYYDVYNAIALQMSKDITFTSCGI